MSLGSQVGSAHVAVFPAMSGFRSAVNKEVRAAGKSSASSFSSSFRGAGQKSGAQIGRELKAAFRSSSEGMADQVLSTFRRDVASATSAVASAQRKMADDAGRLRVAEEQLNAIKEKGNASSAQLAAAEERVASAQRRCEASSAAHKAATERLTAANEALKRAQDEVAKATSKSSNVFSSMAGKVTSSVGKALSGVTSKVTSIGRSAFSRLPTIVQSGVKTAFGGIGGLASKGLSGLRSAASSACRAVGSGFSAMASGIGAAMGVSATAIGAGVAAMGAALAGLGKAAVDAYARYEQLVGGVDTLFGSASAQVQAYASNAYMTAGMSANTYMETVTGFSASLLQGLGGDTARAAEVANMAVTDMSDNANKMGTSIDSIREAYQGFAKDNYDMLDNLKLGYGGTQAEMARLINDSGVLGDSMKVTAENVKDVPFDKMIEAIHKVQTEMGITGTTAKEASTTIEGSVNSAKAAWENWLAGLGTSGADVGALTNQLVEAAGTAAQNIVPRVAQVFQSLTASLPALIYQVGETVMPLIASMGGSLAGAVSTLLLHVTEEASSWISTSLPTLLAQANSWLAENGPSMAQGALSLLTGLATGIVENLPMLATLAVSIVLTLVDGISAQLPELVPLAAQAVINLVLGLLNNLPKIIDSGIKLVQGLAQGVVNAIPTLVSQAPTIIGRLATGIISNLPQIINAGIEIIGSLASGLVRAVPDLIAQIPGIIGQIVTSFSNGDWASVGNNIISGICNGISSAAGWLWDTLTGALSGLVDDAMAFLGIHSPSTVMRDRVGRWIPAGIAEGIEGGAPDLIRRARGVAGGLVRTIEGVSATVGVEAGRAPARGAVSVTQVFNQPVQTPDEFARVMRMQDRYGIAAVV